MFRPSVRQHRGRPFMPKPSDYTLRTKTYPVARTQLPLLGSAPIPRICAFDVLKSQTAGKGLKVTATPASPFALILTLKPASRKWEKDT